MPAFRQDKAIHLLQIHCMKTTSCVDGCKHVCHCVCVMIAYVPVLQLACFVHLHSNCAECYLRVNDAKRAIHDCNRALCLDKTTRVKVQWRRSRAYQKLNLDYPAWLDMK